MGLLSPYKVCRSQPISSRSLKQVIEKTNQNPHKTISQLPPLDLIFFYFYGIFYKNPQKIIETNSIKMQILPKLTRKIYSQTHITIQKPPIKQKAVRRSIIRITSSTPQSSHLSRQQCAVLAICMRVALCECVTPITRGALMRIENMCL